MLGEQLTESEGEGGESAAKSGGKVENRDMYDADTVRVLDAIGHESILVDQVVENCGLTTETVSSIIMRLEIRGEVASAAGGRVLRLHPN
jgi:DNA processing protein